MTITITKVSDKEIPEHWRILITDGYKELFHDSATFKAKAIDQARESLRTHFQWS